MVKRFAAAWRFLTVFPFFWGSNGDEGEWLRRSVSMFPVVGMVLGMCNGVIVVIASRVLPPLPLAALLVAAGAMYSMGLHLDGLADCGDALSSPGRSPERALEIMKDSRIGAHGAAALTLALLAKFSGFASVYGDSLLWAAVAVPVAGRAAMLPPMILLPYLRARGLGAVFGFARPGAVLAWGVCCGVVAAAVAGGAIGVVAWLAATFGWVWFLRRRLGGATGDCFGAACELAETAVALSAAAHVGVF